MLGEIHLANIYFTNVTAFKVQPVLLIRENSFNDVLYMPLTSNLVTSGILIDNNHLKDTYLPKVSVVIYEKIGVMDPALLIRKIAACLSAYYG